MTDSQKVIKYIAIGFAILLIASIVVTIISAFTTFGFLLDKLKNEPQMKGDIYGYSFDNITNLDADTGKSYFKIDTGDKLSVETNSDKVKVYQKGNTLVIEENAKWKNTFSNDVFEITLFVPSNFSFREVDISTGAGKFDAARLSAEDIELQLGAGDVEIDTLEASRDIDIEGGAGRIRINSASLYNLDLEMGVGKLEITGAILGDSNIECGIGDADIALTDTLDSYKIMIDKGIGEAKLNGGSVTNGTSYGNGTNRIKIDCGIGSLNVTTK